MFVKNLGVLCGYEITNFSCKLKNFRILQFKKIQRKKYRESFLLLLIVKYFLLIEIFPGIFTSKIPTFFNKD